MTILKVEWRYVYKAKGKVDPNLDRKLTAQVLPMISKALEDNQTEGFLDAVSEGDKLKGHWMLV